MKQVASLHYDVIFKKAFCDVEIFTAFVKDFTGVTLEIDKVETEKSFKSSIGAVKSRFDLFAQDLKNRVIVDIQHRYLDDHYHRFLHYHCAAILEQAKKSKHYVPELKVFTIVVLTENNPHRSALGTINFDIVDYVTQKNLGEIAHKIVFLSPKHVSDKIPAPYFEWLTAIKDSLDEQVDEKQYKNPAILKIWDLIEEDNLSPEDRARMKDEYALEKALEKKVYKKGIETGIKEGIELGRAEVLEKARLEKLEIARQLKVQGMSLEMIAQITGLTQAILEQL